MPHAYPVSQAYRTTALAPIGTSSGPSGVATGPLFCLSGIARKIDPIGCDRRLALGEAAEGPCVGPTRTLRPGRIELASKYCAGTDLDQPSAAGHRASGASVGKCGTDEQTLEKTPRGQKCGTALIIVHN